MNCHFDFIVTKAVWYPLMIVVEMIIKLNY